MQFMNFFLIPKLWNGHFFNIVGVLWYIFVEYESYGPHGAHDCRCHNCLMKYDIFPKHEHDEDCALNREKGLSKY